MQRYDLEDVTMCGQPWREMEMSDEGEWVLYESAADEIERLRAEVAHLTAAIRRHQEAMARQGEEPCLVDEDLWEVVK